MFVILLVMLVVACIVLFLCGYFLSVIKEKMGKHALMFAPVVVALFMFNIVLILVELSGTR